MKKYFKHKIENLLIVKNIITIHYFDYPIDFSKKGESHDFWEMVYAYKSSVICYVDGVKTEIKEGNAIFHKPYVYHSTVSKTDDTEIFIISFDCKSESMKFFENKILQIDDFCKNIIDKIILESKKTFDIPVSNPETKKMELLTSPTLGGIQIIKNYLELMLISIMRTLTETVGGNTVFFNENKLDTLLINDIKKILQNGVYTKMTVSDVCEKVNYCKSYVFREFKKATGKTLLNYYTELKIKESKKLLGNGYSVKEISEKLCFDTPNYFTKTFKKVTGYTPTEYKLSIKKI